jgi:hypothetical protein
LIQIILEAADEIKIQKLFSFLKLKNPIEEINEKAFDKIKEYLTNIK